MSEINDGGPAFPIPLTDEQEQRWNQTPELGSANGMTLRDYFAAHASEEDIKAQAEVIRSSSTLGILPDGWRVVARYMHADAMLAAREAVPPVSQPASEVLSDDLSKCQRDDLLAAHIGRTNNQEGKQPMSNAFSNALALESVGELGIFNAATGTYSGVTHDDLVSYARTVAYKVFHNLKLGHTMSKEDDPLTVDGVSAADVWADHYEFVSENPLCGEWYRVPYPPTDAMKDAWNNDDSNDFNTAYLAMVHASPAADQCCGRSHAVTGFPVIALSPKIS